MKYLDPDYDGETTKVEFFRGEIDIVQDKRDIVTLTEKQAKELVLFIQEAFE